MINSIGNFASNFNSENSIVNEVEEQEDIDPETSCYYLKEAFEDLCYTNHRNPTRWQQRKEKGLNTIKQVLSTKDNGKMAFKELLRSTIDARAEKQKAICSKMLKLPVVEEIDIMKVVEAIFWGLISLEEEEIIPKMNIDLYKVWKYEYEYDTKYFYKSCFQRSYGLDIEYSDTPDVENDYNLAAMLYILKEIPNNKDIVDIFMYRVYQPVIKNCLKALEIKIKIKIIKKEMFCFLLAEKRITKENNLKVPKFLKIEIFNYLLNTMK